MIAEGATAATPLLDRSMPALLEPGLSHADGQIDGEVFEVRLIHAEPDVRRRRHLHQLPQTRMPAGCARPGTVSAPSATCPQKFDVAEHHHHASGSAGAQCGGVPHAGKDLHGRRPAARSQLSGAAAGPDGEARRSQHMQCVPCGQDAGMGGKHGGWLVSTRQTDHAAGCPDRTARRTRGRDRCRSAVKRTDPGSGRSGDGASQRPAPAGAPCHAGIRKFGDQGGDHRSGRLGSDGNAPCPAGQSIGDRGARCGPAAE